MNNAEDQTPSHDAVRAHNRRAWDALVARRDRFARPANDTDVGQALSAAEAMAWLGRGIAGLRTLCLAAGGGKQSAIYAAAGARVTVVDISPEMLALDRQVAAERKLDIQTVEASMDDLSMLPAGEFELVVHPVSTCYLPDVQPVFREVARAAAPGGIYISQHKTPVSMQAGEQPGAGGCYELREPYYRSGPLPASIGSRLREEGTWEFLHRWEELLGGICRAGFVIEDVVEPRHAEADEPPGSFGHRARFIAPYVRIKARRREEPGVPSRTARKLWTP